MLEARGITVRFGASAALEEVDLTVRDGEIVALLGPSGSGKTTLLRVVAGLQNPDAGNISWDGEALDAIPAHRRGFGLMFQDYALFPHKNVEGNVEFGLRMAGLPPDQTRSRVTEVLDWVGLSGYGDRTIGNLSGGEQQRVALARALAPAPRLLMLDEPVGSLDRTLRERLVGEMRRLFVEHSITVLYVTHDQEEAFALADRIVILRDGRVARQGTPEEVWHDPAGEWVARFLGFGNIVEAVVSGGIAESGFGRFPLPGVAHGRHRMVFRPDAFEISPGGPIRGTVLTRSFRGGHYLLTVGSEDGSILEIEVDRGPAPNPGEAVALAIDPAGIVLLD